MVLHRKRLGRDNRIARPRDRHRSWIADGDTTIDGGMDFARHRAGQTRVDGCKAEMQSEMVARIQIGMSVPLDLRQRLVADRNAGGTQPQLNHSCGTGHERTKRDRRCPVRLSRTSNCAQNALRCRGQSPGGTNVSRSAHARRGEEVRSHVEVAADDGTCRVEDLRTRSGCRAGRQLTDAGDELGGSCRLRRRPAIHRWDR